ncbi:Uncharacterized protein TCM_018276 [Theobroma cacao]|uniref:Uncharacterized protein n=1 Tax=Theobroma cacao TaxID=3641 RepID=A0A061EEC0_THECC|nr:Uncharacterized protein TCM_018276 [Theobroma cacao]
MVILSVCTMWGDAHELGEMGCLAMCTMWGDAHELGEMGCPAMCTMWGDAHELDEMWCIESFKIDTPYSPLLVGYCFTNLDSLCS